MRLEHQREATDQLAIGNVIDRPSQLDFDGLGMSRGVFAPAIEYHDGTFYVVNTAVDSGGNFIATAKDPQAVIEYFTKLKWVIEVVAMGPS